MRPASCPQVRPAGQTDGTSTPLPHAPSPNACGRLPILGHAHMRMFAVHTRACLLTRACLHTQCISGTCHRETRARQREREGILDSHQVVRTRVWDRCNKVHDYAAKFSFFAHCKSHHLAPSPGLQSLSGSEEDWSTWAPRQKSPWLSG